MGYIKLYSPGDTVKLNLTTVRSRKYFVSSCGQRTMSVTVHSPSSWWWSGVGRMSTKCIYFKSTRMLLTEKR